MANGQSTRWIAPKDKGLCNGERTSTVWMSLGARAFCPGERTKYTIVLCLLFTFKIIVILLISIMPKRKVEELIYSDGLTHTYDDACLSRSLFKRRKLNTKKKYKLDNIETLEDLIKLCDFFSDSSVDDHVYDYYKDRLDFAMLEGLKEPLIELRDMTGLIEIKQSIVSQIKLHLSNCDDQDDEMLHTVIYGPPGCGKTTVSHIIAKVYAQLGYLSNGHVVEAKATDLIAKYLGQTAHDTEKVLNKALGGVLLIDEVYQLSSGKDNNNSFAKQCIDTINQYLDLHKHDMICIILGYKEDIDKCFFSLNKGLERRFPIRYTIKKYKSEELLDIFNKKIQQNGYKLPNDPINVFIENESKFPFFGGDIEIFARCCKNAHFSRIFLKKKNKRKILIESDIKKGYQLYLKERSLEDKPKVQLSYYT